MYKKKRISSGFEGIAYMGIQKKKRFDSRHNLYRISQFINRRTNTGNQRITDECTKKVSQETQHCYNKN
ncbi:hypothetical protein KSP40_PGU017803 [Platanthera guangdongensis]|uniref:Uncharacterized protein n=1 Tax=Platanthera guangdongensis TaxID=2320717 RepID=A0ABR2M613_9ASPA